MLSPVFKIFPHCKFIALFFKVIFFKVKKILIISCLQNYGEYLLHATFHPVHSNSKEVVYLPQHSTL